MDNSFISFLPNLLLFIALVILGWVIIRRNSTEKVDQTAILLQQEINQLRVQISKSMENNTLLINQQLGQVQEDVRERLKENSERLDGAARVVGNVQKSLGSLEEANRKIYEVGKDISSLQEILRAPKLRGTMGEFLLDDLLSQILPREHFEMQFTFKSGERVDAIIKLGGSFVPVDSKFPLENFRRLIEGNTEEEKTKAKRQFVADVKKHIDAIASKYILPDEGTYDFALMYIPAENVYYETIIKDDALGSSRTISQEALTKNVIPVSPNSFYAYLQAIVLGLKGMKVEKQAKEILQYLSRLNGDFEKFKRDFALLGKHLGETQASFQNADKRLGQFDDKLKDTEKHLGQIDDKFYVAKREGKELP